MVKLEEVEDDHFAQEQPGPKLENDDDFYTDTGTHPQSHPSSNHAFPGPSPAPSIAPHN